MLSASPGIDRPALELSAQPTATPGAWGPNSAYVITKVSNGTISKADPVTSQLKNLTVPPTSGHPAALLAHVRSRLVKPSESLQWAPADAAQPATVTAMAWDSQSDGAGRHVTVTLPPPPPAPVVTVGSQWPEPTYEYGIILDDGISMSVLQVKGIDTPPQVIDYSGSSSPLSHPISMPGIAMYGEVALQRVITDNTADFWRWAAEVDMNIAPRSMLTINLLKIDPSNQIARPTVTWTLQNAWPTKVAGTDLADGGNQIAIDEILLAYETLVITNHADEASAVR